METTVRTVYEIRRRNLRQLIEDDYFGRPFLLAEKLGLNRNYVYKLLSDPEKSSHKRIGDRQARQIEQTCGLPIGLLDQRPEDLEASAILQQIEALTPEHRRAVESLIRSLGPVDE